MIMSLATAGVEGVTFSYYFLVSLDAGEQCFLGIE